MLFPDWLRPDIFTLELFGLSFTLRWYALAYIAGLLLGWQIVVALMRRPRLWGGVPPMTPKEPEALLTWMVLGVVIGGRLGFVLFYDPLKYLENPLLIPQVWEGGMSFHGGFLGVVLGVIGWSLRNDAPMLRVGDAVAVATPAGLFFGRIANFINAELWGRPTEVPWGVLFPDPRAQFCPYFTDGPCFRHPSQLYEAALEGLVLGVVLLWMVRSGALRVPGRMIGAFLLGYGVARTFCEGFRQGDEQFVSADNPFDNPFGHILRAGSGPDAWGLTMGQLLSLPMVAVGAAILIATARRARRPA